MRNRIARMAPGPGSLLAAALAVALPLAGQAPREGRAEVELPLSTYDALRAAAKEKKVERKEAPFASARLVRASLAVDLSARRATWEAEIAAQVAGDDPPAVLLLSGATPVGRSAVTPDGASLRSDGARLSLVPGEPGNWRVTLSGEITGQGNDEAAGIRFAVPPLATLPAAFDLTVPSDSSAVDSAGGPISLSSPKGDLRSGRLTLTPGRETLLVVSRARRAAAGPPVLDVGLHTVVRLSEESVRSEVRLALAVRKGVLAERKVTLPPGSLVSVTGPVTVDGPRPDGTALLKLEPPLEEGSAVTLLLALVLKNDPAAGSFTPALPSIPLAATDRLETELTVVSEGGLLLTPGDDADWAPRPSMDGVRIGADETALGFSARAAAPKPPAFAIRRLKALAVASALARVSLTAYVGESGETRTRLVADIRSRGRAALRFRVPADARLLAARVDGRAAAASRPAAELLEVPIDSRSGRTRVELLLGGKGGPPRAGEKLTVAPAGPEEPVERVSWRLVLPPGLSVKDESKRLAPVAEPPAPPSRPREETPAAEQAAAQEAARLAAEDRRARRDGSWSPRADLPNAPAAFATDLADLEGPIAPLTVQLVETKEKSPWY